ncbi:MAG: sigma-70 family RNA polymerase sigma factor [Acidimicrobiia bacterium]
MRDEFATASDAVLVQGIASHQQRALAEAYRRHAGAVLGLAKRFVDDRAQAEEVVQEVFLRLWNDAGRYDPARGALRSFLLAHAHGRSVDLMRSEGARRRREERDARSSTNIDDLDLAVLDLAMAGHVRAALQRLPEGERAAIELAYFAGHTYRDVALRLGEPEGTVKSRIRSGLRRLRGELVAHGVTMSDG